MAGKPKPMSQIKQLILLRQRGEGIKTIARTLGMSKNTVKSYLAKLGLLTERQETPVPVEELFKLEAPVLEAKLHPGNPAYKDARFDHFKGKVDFYIKELKRIGVNKRLLWEEYKQEIPEAYSYSQFCFHLSQHQKASKGSMVLEHKPGEKLFIDFAGKKLSYLDKENGELVQCQVFVACLPYSDYCFAMAVKSQNTEDFLYALSCCLEDMGGVPQVLVPDNLKAAVVKANQYEPTINRAMEDFANHYGATVIPARPRKPRDKALVENQVKLIYSRVYAKLRNTQFFDLHSLNQAIKEKVKAHNQTRMQGKPYCREEKFLAEEKGLLTPLPGEKFEIKYYREFTVNKNNHIRITELDHYFSAPYKFIGHKVKVIYTRSMVYIFFKGEQIAVHYRGFKVGKYTSNEDHLCSTYKHYRDRSPEYYIREAKAGSETLCRLISLIFGQDRYPEQLYKTCDGIFNLYRKTEAKCFEKACLMAIEHQNYSYLFIKNILENKMTEQVPEVPDKPLPKHNNVRGKEYYQNQLELKFSH